MPEMVDNRSRESAMKIRELIVFLIVVTGAIVPASVYAQQAKLSYSGATDIRWVPGPTGKTIVRVDDSEAVIVNLETKDVIGSLRGNRIIVLYFPDESFVALGSPVGAVQVWNLKEGASHQAPSLGVVDLFYRRSAEELGILSLDGTVIFWNPAQKKKTAELEKAQIRSVLLLNDENILFTGHEEGGFTLWEADTLKEIHTIQAHRIPIEKIEYLKVGDDIKSSETPSPVASENDKPALTKAPAGKETQTPAATPSKDRENLSLIVTSDSDGNYHIWNANIQELLKNASAELQKKAEELKKRALELQKRTGEGVVPPEDPKKGTAP